MIRIGTYIPARNGQKTVIQRGCSSQGFIFKDEEAYLNCPQQVCYVPELSDVEYTHYDFLRICDLQESLARRCFYDVDWQSPETWFDEQINTGELIKCEICGRVYDSENNAVCPHCEGKGIMHDTLRCPHCGQPVIPSDIPEYSYQCLFCEEDFYTFEVQNAFRGKGKGH